MNELPGNVRVMVLPLNSIGSVLGETFIGSSNEFSAAPLSAVSTMARTLPVRFLAPVGGEVNVFEENPPERRRNDVTGMRHPHGDFRRLRVG